MFDIGISPDFYVDARGRFETLVQEQMQTLRGVSCSPMPPQPGKRGTPEALNAFDAIFALAIQITPESLVGVDRLAVVARWGVGYDRIDVDALTAAGIALCITPEAVRRPVTEAILTLIFALSKRLFLQDRVTRQGGWRSDLPQLAQDVKGQVLGSIGCGNIARELFSVAKHLGFHRMLAFDPYIRPEQAAELGVDLVDLPTLLRDSDFVTVNTLLNQGTRGLIGEAEFHMMKPTAYFINTARGPIVQHDALVRALREKRIAGAGIDVFPIEPPPADDPLFELDNVIVTPHALAWTENIFAENGREAFRNVLMIAQGQVPPGLVNRDVLNQSSFQRKLRTLSEAHAAPLG